MTLRLAPALDIPLGEGAARYRLGGGGSIAVAYGLPTRLPLWVGAEVGYGLIPFELSESKNLNTASLGGAVGLDLPVLGRLLATARAGAGYYQGFTRDSSGELVTGGNPYLSGAVGLGFRLNPSLAIGASATVRSLLGSPEPLLTAVGAGLELVYRRRIGEMRAPDSLEIQPLRIQEVTAQGIFPVFYQYYDTHPIGQAVISNQGRLPLRNLSVEVFINRYMDRPKTMQVTGELGRGEQRTIDLYALFNENVLEITEGTKVAAEVKIDYEVRGARQSLTQAATLRLEHRNASIWDDDRRAAAFVTAKDPAVLKFAKNVAALVREGANQTLDDNLRLAIAMHEALVLQGVSYVPDPKTPYIEYVKDKQAIDFLQFPRQTLEYLAGDCDDLSILYAALLEAVSVDTAFITVPGHIYIAVALQMGLEETKKILERTDDLIVRDGRVWLPLEVTETRRSFRYAWERGAQQWREQVPKGNAALYPLAEAWRTFEPVGLPGETDLELPRTERLAGAFEKELAALVDRELEGRVRALEAQIKASQGNARLVNNLGVLYARYGLLEKAEGQFQRILSAQVYVPALQNLGNLYLVRRDFRRAADYYRRALQRSPDSPGILLGLAQASRELGDTVAAKESYERLARVSPDTASRFSYLAEGPSEVRASGSWKGEVLWQE